MSAPEVTPTQAARFLDDCLSRGQAVVMHGHPGVGKSALGMQSAKRLGMKMYYFKATKYEAQAVSGLPMVVTDKHGSRTSFARPDDIPAEDDHTPAVVFCDEPNRASPMTQNGLMGLWERPPNLAGHRLPPEAVALGAVNPASSSGAQRLIDALANRAAHVFVVPDADAWIDWAWKQPVFEPTIIALIDFHREGMLMAEPQPGVFAYPTPRTWAAASNLFTHPGHHGGLGDEQLLLSSLIGEGAAAALRAFRHVKLPNPDAIIMNPDSAEVPNDPQALVALCVTLAARADAGNFARIIQYCDRLADPSQYQLPDRAPAGLEWSTLTIRHALRRTPELQADPAFCRWVVDHREAFGGV